MTEMKVYPGKCKCEKKLKILITTLYDDEEVEVLGWMIYGSCKKCNVVYVLEIWTDKTCPCLDRDYMIDYKMVVK